ncbi:hypothetical protein [Rhizobium sp. 2MFCol3.1]|uniref:hypothetical protein n=1 Tax=unclassified Rhizobium TaxID=2613769 RepID=UPI0012DEA63A|nr:hypothetical protein [Rhizobium sp. 2MFCol3.1]
MLAEPDRPPAKFLEVCIHAHIPCPIALDLGDPEVSGLLTQRQMNFAPLPQQPSRNTAIFKPGSAKSQVTRFMPGIG